ncbi:MAG: hypothetical protein JXX29_01840, partial [Deltaproteobacteria bacterium]|nr:hypothetical protein [Deltaproteobacteria bacterium]
DSDTDSDSDSDSDTDSDSDSDTDADTDSDTDSDGDCQYPDPPENVADWVNESWSAQLDDNINGREVWMLDKAIKGEGEINICVRWGATTAPSANVKNNIEAMVELWFNDWFTLLDGYGCFPYPEGVTVNLTGWAVRPGNESWVDDLDDSVFIYTETDGSGEPICSSSCSTFDNWNYSIPNCPGGDAARHDYWLWLDDTIEGGAAAVGGDWGLRMPLAGFENALNSGDGDLVIEHEMGHGFGFQDYYDWTGSTPEGGSLMIVGSAWGATSPTEGDAWLLRRTWKEQQAIRGW